jgi:heme a synthase
VYLVIFAGAFVRLTGSGMGCPDWPKCFGYYIPPTQEKELLFTPKKEYEKGQVIIKDESLLVAKTDFVATTTFKISDWEKYTKHDYAVFNPLHTWVEYINRLLGALAGIACIITFIFSFGFWRERKKLVVLTFLICLLMGFQAWLGKTVVDSVLNPVKITTHMLAALLIIAFQLITIHSVQKNTKPIASDIKFSSMLWVTFALTIVQVILGTSVREHVDTISEMGLPKSSWLQDPSISFYIHRTFSIAILLFNSYLFLRNRNMKFGFQKINWVIALLLVEIFSGIAMYYFDFPFGTQTIHIVLATLLFGVQFYMILESNSKKTIL